jgi:hypothetical protein
MGNINYTKTDWSFAYELIQVEFLGMNFDIFKDPFLKCFNLRQQDLKSRGFKNGLYTCYKVNDINGVPWFYKKYILNYNLTFENFCNEYFFEIGSHESCEQWLSIFRWREAYEYFVLRKERYEKHLERLKSISAARISQAKKSKKKHSLR